MKTAILSIVFVLIFFVLFCSAAEKERGMTLHQDYPVVEGEYLINKYWKMTLPVKFNQRFDKGDLVIWRSGFTMWISVWNNDKKETIENRLNRISDDTSPHAYNRETEKEEHIIRYSYRLKEESDDTRQAAFHCFAIGIDGHAQMVVYFDNPKDISMAKDIWRSITETKNKD